MKQQPIPVLLIYANSSNLIGGGHVMRQMALAQAAKAKGYTVVFIYKYCSSSITLQLQELSFTRFPLASDCFEQAIKTHNASALIIDDYSLTTEQKQKLKSITIPIIVFDDQTDQEAIVASLIVNSADNISQKDYHHRTSSAQFCLGRQYRLIRPVFLQKRTQLPTFQRRKRILISLGDADIKQLTLTICQGLLELSPYLPLDIVIGRMSTVPHKLLMQLVKQYPNISVHKNVNDLSNLMANSGMAISTAGGTLYELATLGVPTISLCVIDNQRSSLTSKLNNNGYLSFNLINYPANDSLLPLLLQQSILLWQDIEKRIKMSLYQQKHIDGLGADRIVLAIEHLLEHHLSESHLSENHSEAHKAQ